MAWADTLQEWGTILVQGAADKTFSQDFELDKMRIQALGDLGYYTEGQTGRYVQPAQGISPGLLLIGAGLVLVLLLKD